MKQRKIKRVEFDKKKKVRTKTPIKKKLRKTQPKKRAKKKSKKNKMPEAEVRSEAISSKLPKVLTIDALLNILEDLETANKRFRQSQKLLEDIYEISITLSGSADKVIDTICKKVHDVFGAFTVTVSIGDKKNVYIKTGVGLRKDMMKGKEALKDSLCTHVLHAKRPLFTNDLKHDKCPNCKKRYNTYSMVDMLNLNSYIGVPLIIGGKVVGSFCSYFKEKRDISEFDLKVLTLFAQRISMEMERGSKEKRRTEITQKTLDAEKLLEDIYEISITLTGKPEKVVDTICKKIHDVFNAFTVSVSLRDKKTVYLKTGKGLRKNMMKGKEALKDNLCNHVMHTRKPIYTSDLKHDKCPKCKKPYNTYAMVEMLNLNSYIGIPLKDSAGKTVGSLCTYFKEKRKVSNIDLKILTLFGTRISLELQRAKQK